MTLSVSAKRNIAANAMANYFGDHSNVMDAALAIASNIIEKEIGLASEDIAPQLFNELVAEIVDPLISILSQQ